MHYDGASTLLIIGISTLSIIYFFKAFSSENQTDPKISFISKIGNIGLSIALIGSLFKLMVWEGSGVQLSLGITAILIALAAILYFRNKADYENSFSPKFILRLVIIGSIAGFFAFITDHDIMNFNHKDDPEYVRLFFNMKDHPKDPKARKVFDAYRKAKFEKLHHI